MIKYSINWKEKFQKPSPRTGSSEQTLGIALFGSSHLTDTEAEAPKGKAVSDLMAELGLKIRVPLVLCEALALCSTTRMVP